MAYRAGRFPARNMKSRVRPQAKTVGAGKAKTIKNTLNNVAKVAKKGAEFTETIANEPLDQVALTCLKLAGSMGNPIGYLGLSLMPSAAKERSVSGDAVGDVTTSATMYAYRPPRKRNREGEITYIQKATTTFESTSNANLAVVRDLNILDATAVASNSTTNPYSRMTIRKCFDQYLTAQVETDASPTAYRLKEQQTSIHVKSVASELLIKNNSTNITLVEIYELVPQHTIGPSTFQAQTYAEGYMSPTWSYANGLSDTLQLEDGIGYTNVAARPTDSSLWYKTWKVIKKVRVNLTSGSLHRHKSCIAVNKTVSYPEMAQFSTSGGKFPGWNPTYMIIQKGAPNATNSATATDLTCSCNMEMRYTASAQEQARVIIYDSAT